MMNPESPPLPAIADDVPILGSDSINSEQPNDAPLVEIRGTAASQTPMGKHRILKNLLVMSSCLFLYFLGFQALANLQSTMNAAQGLGVECQAVMYAFCMISCLLLPELVIKRIGNKRALVVSVCCSCCFIAANFYPRWDTLLPSSALMGLAAGPLNTAEAMYVTEMAVRYKPYTAESQEAVVSTFYGVYSFFMENTQIWGNLISFYVLSAPMLPIHVNSTVSRCGVDFRRDSSNRTNPNLDPPSEERRFLLVGVFLACGLAAALLMGLFLDPLGSDVAARDNGKGGCATVVDRLLAAVRQLGDVNQLLLLPISVYCGMAMAFYTSDFTQAYIACSWGVQHVGFVSICFGVCGALMALLAGPLVKCASQVSVITFAAVINVGVCVTLFLWRPSPDEVAVYFIIAGVWGMADAIWWSQVTALYGLMFPNDREAAFSNFYFWSFLGYFLCYSYANYVTVVVKINILLCMLISGMAGYYLCLLRIRCSASSREYAMLGHDD